MNNRFMKIFSAISVLTMAALACSVFAPVVTDNGGNGNGGGGSNVNNNGSRPTNSGGGESNNNGGLTNNGGGNDTSGRPLFSDNFEGRNSNWGTGTDSDSVVEYVNGALQFNVITTKYFVFSQPNNTSYQNVHIEVTAQNNSTDPKAAFGIMCNQQVTDSAYYAYITPSGAYAIAMSAVAKDDVELVSGTSDLIAKNAKSYRIGLDCSNGTLTLYVDGQKIDSTTDSTYTDGYVALFAWSDKIASGTNVTFDDFVITSLP